MGKKGGKWHVVAIFGGWTLKMFIIMTKQVRFWNAHDLASNLFEKTACLSHQHTLPSSSDSCGRVPPSVQIVREAPFSTATPRNNWWIETRAHQLKVVEYLLSLGYCFFLSGRVSIPGSFANAIRGLWMLVRPLQVSYIVQLRCGWDVASFTILCAWFIWQLVRIIWFHETYECVQYTLMIWFDDTLWCLERFCWTECRVPQV